MAASGMYSVISCLVSQRTNEIAVRIALGARGVAIMRTILVYTMAWVVAGVAAGVGLGAAASRMILSLTNSAIPVSGGVYVDVVLFFLAVTLLAAYVPVRRAIRVDPAVALRGE